MKPLTPEQQELVEENHKLIFAYAYEKEIDLEEHYGRLAYALCRASQCFDPEKGNFSTVAYRCMQGEMSHYYYTLNRQKRVPQNLIKSLSQAITSEFYEGKEVTLEDVIPDPNNAIDVFENEYLVSLMLECLNDRERYILTEYYIQGRTLQSIADELGCTKERIRQININSIGKIRKKFNPPRINKEPVSDIVQRCRNLGLIP